jgi:hypothetical protein
MTQLRPTPGQFDSQVKQADENDDAETDNTPFKGANLGQNIGDRLMKHLPDN